MKKGRKKLIITLSILAVLLIVFFGAIKALGGKNNNLLRVQTTEVSREEIMSTVISDGTVQSKEQRKIICDLPYEIAKIFAREGAAVKKGEILARLDTRELQYRVREAEINLELKRSEYQNMTEGSKALELQKQLENAEITYQNFKRQYENAQKLFQEKVISRDELEEARVKAGMAANDLEVAREKFRAAERDALLKEKEIRLEELKLAQQKEILEEAHLESPIDGTVVASNAEIGIPAELISPLFIIEDTNNLEIELKISQYDINRVRVGQKVEVTGEAFKENYTGRVTYIAPRAEAAGTGMGEGETSVGVKVEILDATEEIKPGFSASVSIKTGSKQDALVVPYEVLFQKADGSTVIYKVEGGFLKEIPVKTGIEGDLEIEVIADDLHAGDKIAVNPNENFKDGMAVEVLSRGDNSD